VSLQAIPIRVYLLKLVNFKCISSIYNVPQFIFSVVNKGRSVTMAVRRSARDFGRLYSERARRLSRGTTRKSSLAVSTERLPSSVRSRDVRVGARQGNNSLSCQVLFWAITKYFRDLHCEMSSSARELLSWKDGESPKRREVMLGEEHQTRGGCCLWGKKHRPRCSTWSGELNFNDFTLCNAISSRRLVARASL